MKPSRELDALIAEKVMGWVKPRPEWVATTPDSPWVNPKDGQGYRLDEIPRYSTDIAAAWEVVEKLKADHALTIHAANHAGYGWLVHIDSGIKQIGDTAPHAICLAALKAVRGSA